MCAEDEVLLVRAARRVVRPRDVEASFDIGVADSPSFDAAARSRFTADLRAGIRASGARPSRRDAQRMAGANPRQHVAHPC